MLCPVRASTKVTDLADFEHQASYGDYTAEDRAEADRRWVLAQAAAETLRTHTTR